MAPFSVLSSTRPHSIPAAVAIAAAGAAGPAYVAGTRPENTKSRPEESRKRNLSKIGVFITVHQ